MSLDCKKWVPIEIHEKMICRVFQSPSGSWDGDIKLFYDYIDAVRRKYNNRPIDTPKCSIYDCDLDAVKCSLVRLESPRCHELGKLFSYFVPICDSHEYHSDMRKEDFIRPGTLAIPCL